MTKGQNKTAEPARKVRRRIRPKIGVRMLTNYLMIPLVTVIIVGIGVFIPVILLKGRADPSKLPSGYVDIEYVQPYGAAYRLSEQTLSDSAHEYNMFAFEYSGTLDLSEYEYRDIAQYDQQYSQIGTGGNEFLYDFTTLARESFAGYESVVPDWEIRDLSENIVLLGDGGYANGYALDRESGVPIRAEVDFISSSDQFDVTRFFYETIDLYNSYTGLDFSTEIDNSVDNTSFFQREILTSDNALSLDIEVSCVDYYSYDATVSGVSDGEYYYVWHVTIALQSTDEPYFSMAVG